MLRQGLINNAQLNPPASLHIPMPSTSVSCFIADNPRHHNRAMNRRIEALRYFGPSTWALEILVIVIFVIGILVIAILVIGILVIGFLVIGILVIGIIVIAILVVGILVIGILVIEILVIGFLVIGPIIVLSLFPWKYGYFLHG